MALLGRQDLAILAATSAGRRKWIYYDRRLWTACSNPAIAVINAVSTASPFFSMQTQPWL